MCSYMCSYVCSYVCSYKQDAARRGEAALGDDGWGMDIGPIVVVLAKPGSKFFFSPAVNIATYWDAIMATVVSCSHTYGAHVHARKGPPPPPFRPLPPNCTLMPTFAHI